MTYHFKQLGPTRQIGVGADDDTGLATIARVLEAFLPKLNEIQSQGDAAAQAEVDKIVSDATGGAAKPTSPITQTTTGGAVGSSDFLVVGGVCKPRNKPALDLAKQLQLQLNRVAKLRGFSSIGVDGDIGPGTLALVRKVSPTSVANACTDVTSKLPALVSAVKSMADSAGAPQITQADLAKAATAGTINVTATNGQTFAFKPPGVKATLLDTIKNLPDTTKIAIGGVALLGGIYALKKVRGRGGARPALPAATPTSNPRRRRRRRR